VYQDKIISNHIISLSAHFGEGLDKFNFNKPYILADQNDSVVSDSPSKKTAYITRHLLTSEVTHSIILDRDWYQRL